MKNKRSITILATILIAILLGAGGYAYYSNSLKDPWKVFEKYVGFIKNHDMTGINSLSVNKRPACTNTVEQCNNELDFVYNTMSKINKTDYVTRWEDDRQIILITDPKKNDTADTRGYIRSYIYFTKDSAGDLKVLSVSTGGGWSHSTIGTTLDEAGIDEALQAMMLDTDKDGLTDQQERCEGASQFLACTASDPTNRDSNGNGWWDGIEAKFK